MKTLLKLLVVAASLLMIPCANAAVSPVGVSIFSPVEFPPRDFNIVGARVNLLLGDNRSVYGFDFGAIGSETDLNFVGIGVSGGFNYNRGESTIIFLQAAGITNVNVNKSHIYGVQLAAIANVNEAESTLIGFGVALGNYDPYTTVWGAQLGIYNRAQTVNGFQIGLINSTKNLHGLQIGLINFNETGLFEIAPILNIGF